MYVNNYSDTDLRVNNCCANMYHVSDYGKCSHSGESIQIGLKESTGLFIDRSTNSFKLPNSKQIFTSVVHTNSMIIVYSINTDLI